jgi:hypothetical protein
MPQPIGPQAAADDPKLLEEAPLDVESDPTAPNIDKAFSALWLPHSGQINSTLALSDRTNFSYLSSQS